MEADLITAAGDGLGPALLLTLPERLRPQYLFNVPEGFSRYALEHKIRPGLGLRAAFLADLSAATGLPGLVMRLRGEGHGQLEVLGPPGTLPFVSSLRHFVHWRHPAVLVSEAAPPATGGAGRQAAAGPRMDGPEVYEDEHVAAAALWEGGGGGGGARLPPEWLADGGGRGQRDGEAARFDKDALETSSSSSEESGASRSTSSGGGTSSSSDDGSGGGSGGSSSGSSDDSSDDQTSSSDDEDSCGGGGASGLPPKARDEAMFAALDAAFTSAPGPRARAQAMGLLGRQAQAPAAAPGVALAAALAQAQAASAGDRDTRTVAGRVYRKIDAQGVSVFARERRGEASGAVAAPQPGGSPPRLLGYALLIKSSEQVLVVATCGTQHELEQLEAHPALQALRSAPPSRVAACVVALGPDLAGQPAAAAALARLPAPLFLMELPGPGAASTELGYVSSARTSARLAMVSPDLFPLPAALRHPAPPPPLLPQLPGPLVTGLTKLVWTGGVPAVKPREARDGEAAPRSMAVDVAATQAALRAADPDLEGSLKHARAQIEAATQNLGRNGSAPPLAGAKRPAEAGGGSNKRAAAVLQARLRGVQADLESPPPPPPPPPPPAAAGPAVTFLGTGSAEPSQHRGSSAILLSMGDGAAPCVLLDCGEGCWGQMVRALGAPGAAAAVARLAAIWVSHRHADHMSGVLQLLQHRPPGAPPLLLAGPRALGAWLAEAAPAAGVAGRFSFAHCSDLQARGHWARAALCGALGLADVAVVAVRHCPDAHGLVLRCAAGWSLVYSGDTQPSEALVRAGAGATLLIHEATFEPALAAEARRKRHSTSAEAMDVARRMRAGATVLTHFSQRYPKFPEGVAAAAAAAEATGAAFDGMRLPLAALRALPAAMQGAVAVLRAAEAAGRGERVGADGR